MDTSETSQRDPRWSLESRREPKAVRAAAGRERRDTLGDDRRSSPVRDQAQLPDRRRPGTAGPGHVERVVERVPGDLQQRQHDLDRHEDVETIAGLKILRFDGGLFFVNADALADRLRQIRVEEPTGIDGVILSMEGVNFIDTEGADVLMSIARAGIDHGIDLHLARVKPQVIDVLERDGFFDLVDRSHVHDNIEAAVAMHQTLHPTAPSG